MIAKPRKGYYFPISPARADALTREWLWVEQDGRRIRNAIDFANPTAKRDGIPVAQLSGPVELTVFSMPEGADSTTAVRATEAALALCSELSAAWQTPRGNVWQNYMVVLADSGVLVIMRRLTQYRPQKYRGTQKFSHASKAKMTTGAYVEVRRVAID